MPMSLPDSVRLIRVPTGLPVGDVNCYLILGEPLTLIDTGLMTDEAWAAIERGFAEVGLRPGDVEQILLTHGHVDHAGLCSRLSSERLRLHGDVPRVFIHERDHHRVVDYDSFIERRAEAYVRVAKMAGVPPESLSISPSLIVYYFRELGASIPHATPVRNSTVFDSGAGGLKIVDTPGHTMGSMCLVLEAERVVFCGDHILGDISSNPSIDFDSVDDIPMRIYLQSIERMLPYSGYLFLPGHRSFITDVNARIEELRHEYSTKLERVMTLLGQKPKTLFEVSRMLFGSYRFDQLILAISETFDLLRILRDQGRITMNERDGVWVAQRAIL